MEAKRAVYIDPELHKKLGMLARKCGTPMYKLAEMGVASIIGKLWNKKAAK